MLKKTTLAVIGLAASSFASAGAMGPVCAPGNVTVPSCEANRWDLGIDAVYLQALYGSNKGYNRIVPQGYSQVNNKWNLGFRAEGSYHFNAGNDITVDWLHYSSDTNQSGFLGIVPVPPVPSAAPVGSSFFQSPFTVISKNRVDQLNLVMGQHTDVGLVKKMRIYGGMQYANIQSNSTNYYPRSFVLNIGAFSPISLVDNTDFKGFGPVFGIDYSYNVTSAWSVTAKGAGSILYGTSRYNGEYIANSAGLVIGSVYQANKNIVPSVEAKLGLNYEYVMPQGVMNVAGGYQVVNYFNALSTQVLQNLANPISYTNYGLYGPYLGVKYIGNA